jgi:hypothetical protein
LALKRSEKLDIAAGATQKFMIGAGEAIAMLASGIQRGNWRDFASPKRFLERKLASACLRCPEQDKLRI